MSILCNSRFALKVQMDIVLFTCQTALTLGNLSRYVMPHLNLISRYTGLQQLVF